MFRSKACETASAFAPDTPFTTHTLGWHLPSLLHKSPCDGHFTPGEFGTAAAAELRRASETASKQSKAGSVSSQDQGVGNSFGFSRPASTTDANGGDDSDDDELDFSDGSSFLEEGAEHLQAHKRKIQQHTTFSGFDIPDDEPLKPAPRAARNKIARAVSRGFDNVRGYFRSENRDGERAANIKASRARAKGKKRIQKKRSNWKEKPAKPRSAANALVEGEQLDLDERQRYGGASELAGWESTDELPGDFGSKDYTGLLGGGAGRGFGARRYSAPNNDLRPAAVATTSFYGREHTGTNAAHLPSPKRASHQASGAAQGANGGGEPPDAEWGAVIKSISQGDAANSAGKRGVAFKIDMGQSDSDGSEEVSF